MPTRSYPAVVRKTEDNNFTLEFANVDMTSGSASGSSVEEAIRQAEVSLAEQLGNWVKHTGSLPDSSSIFEAPGEAGLFRVLLTVEIPSTMETLTAHVTSDLAKKIKSSAKNDGTDTSGLLNEAARQLVGESAKGYSYFYRALMRLTSDVKNKIHLDTERKYQEPNGKKWVRKFCSPFVMKDPNYEISLEVYNRLLLRYALLRDIEKLESRYGAHISMNTRSTGYGKSVPPEIKGSSDDEKEASDIETKTYTNTTRKGVDLNPAIRAYKLATTDVFVEKAIAYLEVDSDKYRRRGSLAFLFGIVVITVGLTSSFVQVFPDVLSIKVITPQPTSWLQFVVSFSKSFTFYGLLVLLVVGLWRIGRAMLDQAERLRERRHALRQGRLYVHLNDGELDPDELDKAFDWNKTGGNAFGEIQTEASAPWGAVFKEAFKAFGETFKKSVEKAAEKAGEKVVG